MRSNLWYTLRRRGIEIPYPIQVEYSREEQAGRPPARIRYVADRLAEIDLFAGLDDVERARLAEACPEHLFGAGERIVRQGDAGQSMFVVLDGRVRVTLEPSGQEVAVTSRGGFFGEMSMLTGDPRTATVSALDDALLLEITAERFRELAVMRHGLVEHVSDRGVGAAGRAGVGPGGGRGSAGGRAEQGRPARADQELPVTLAARGSGPGDQHRHAVTLSAPRTRHGGARLRCSPGRSRARSRGGS